MQKVFSVLFLGLVICQAPTVAAGQEPTEERAGDVYLIRMQSVSETNGDGSSSSSRSSWTLEERVVGMRDDGVEVEFDLPRDASQEDRARNWQFPARILSSPNGEMQLLNGPELQARIRTWLQLGGFTEADCGRWIFTWDAFKIECNPQSVLETLSAVNLRRNFDAGALYDEPAAGQPVALSAHGRDADGETLIAQLEIDPDSVRRGRAESDVVVAEIIREPISIETALQRWQAKQVSGTITATIVRDATGRVTNLTRRTQINIVDESGAEERQTSTTTVERNLILQ